MFSIISFHLGLQVNVRKNGLVFLAEDCLWRLCMLVSWLLGCQWGWRMWISNGDIFSFSRWMADWWFWMYLTRLASILTYESTIHCWGPIIQNAVEIVSNRISDGYRTRLGSIAFFPDYLFKRWGSFSWSFTYPLEDVLFIFIYSCCFWLVSMLRLIRMPSVFMETGGAHTLHGTWVFVFRSGWILPLPPPRLEWRDGSDVSSSRRLFIWSFEKHIF